ncbi:hypothetical protein TNCV_4990151 [Trichonephila clavipes]|uniref:Uncharacterized protein n=1 Tax=Trichonephila clavipes TaxID=2585209 RepID=A0A8X7BH34_TRICX|nr:hypothetical protein TNCV_4990151 [Trichonephila clavipes]
MNRAHGSQVVKESDRGWHCHEFEPSTTKDPPCRAVMHVNSVKSSNVFPLVNVANAGGLEVACLLRKPKGRITRTFSAQLFRPIFCQIGGVWVAVNETTCSDVSRALSPHCKITRRFFCFGKRKSK